MEHFSAESNLAAANNGLNLIKIVEKFKLKIICFC